jgi:hypothetical protein
MNSTMTAEAHGQVPRTCIHIGLPKTATTMIQRHLFKLHPELLYGATPLKLGNFDPEGRCTRLIDDICLDRSYDIETGRKFLHDDVGPNLSGDRIFLLSDELFSFNGSVDQGLQATGLIDRREKAQRLKDVFGDARIILVIRRPADWIRALYLQRLKGYGKKHRDFESLETWLERHLDCRNETRSAASNLHYGELAELYAGLFGKENVGVFLYEELLSEPATFIADIAGFIGIDTQQAVSLTEGKRENETLTKRQLLLSHLRAQSRIGEFLVTSPTLQPLRRAVASVLPGRAPLRPEFPERLAEEVADYCRDDLRRLASRWQLPLDQHGYPV